MKQSILFSTFLIGLTCLQHCQCKGDDPTPVPPPPVAKTCDTCLPAITTSGKNTFGCRVNGVVWLPKGGPISPATNIDYYNSHVVVNAFKTSTTEFIDLDVAPILDTGTFNFYTPSLTSQWGRYINPALTINYNADTIYHGFIHISKFDPVGGVIAGTFAFDAYNPQGDTVHITDGRFDLHL